MKNLFLILTVLGALGPLSALTPWVSANGLNLLSLLQEMFGTPVSRFASMDVVFAGLTVLALVVRGHQAGVKNAWLAGLGTVVVGPSFGLPLYLYFEVSQGDEA